MLRTRCFLGCAQTGKHLLRTRNVSEQNQKHFLCPGHKMCVRNKCCARGQTGKHLCRQQCVRNNVSSFASTLSFSTKEFKGTGKRGQIVADTLLPTQMFPVCPRPQHLLRTQILCRDAKNVSDFAQKHFVSAANVSQFAQPKKHHEQQCVLVCQYLKKIRTPTTTSLNKTFNEQAPVVQRLDNAIHRINRYPADKC